ncbi:hypothetical protein [Peristeroidobacter agariperforans]|uniref:hypothetical protein n=1 Tax=Peristeroidobacter agariperforans TaxID=268404 RepID=UPI00101DF5FE|nr:hypothetical protein [Peristeroidobacter agariperforans]
MTDTTKNKSDLVFFTQVVGRETYGAWYRVLPVDCIEILAIGLMRTLPLDGRDPEDVACDALEEFVRARIKLGQPVPALPAEVTVHANHTCPPKNPEGVTH